MKLLLAPLAFLLVVSCAPIKPNTKEHYSWGKWDSSSENKDRVLKKKNKIKVLLIQNYADTIFPNDFVLQFQKLKYLTVDGIYEAPKKIYIDTVKLAKLKHLKSLSIGFFTNDSFPVEFTILDSLKRLDIFHCNIVNVPNDIAKFKCLKSLYLMANSITTFPDSIKNLKELKTINLANNKFQSFPKALNNLPKIKYITLSNYWYFKEDLNRNEIDYIKDCDYLFQLSTKSTLKTVYIEVRDWGERKYVVSSFRREMKKMGPPLLKDIYKKKPLDKLSITTK